MRGPRRNLDKQLNRGRNSVAGAVAILVRRVQMVPWLVHSTYSIVPLMPADSAGFFSGTRRRVDLSHWLPSAGPGRVRRYSGRHGRLKFEST